MAMIQCPECKNEISDQAEACPKCGYALKKQAEPNEQPADKRKKFDYKHLIIGLAVLVVGFFMLNQARSNSESTTSGTPSSAQPTASGTQPGTTPSATPSAATPATKSGYVVYSDANLGLQYEIPANYKTFAEKGLTYIGKNIDEQGATIPYVLLGWDTTYKDPAQFLNAFTAELQKTYNDVAITIDLLSGTIGGRTVYGIQYRYTASGHTVIDNRYATMVGNNLLRIGSREENANTQEVNNVVSAIIETLKEVG